jgi:DNA-directed RNA polymerase subunit omega
MRDFPPKFAFAICMLSSFAPFRSIRPQNSIKFASQERSNFLIAYMGGADRLFSSFSRPKIVNAELCKKAAEKVGNPNVLVNLISRRVRQLNSGGGGLSRPLVANTTNLGVGDIALREIIEEKIGWELPEPVELVRPQAKKRRKR